MIVFKFTTINRIEIMCNHHIRFIHLPNSVDIVPESVRTGCFRKHIHHLKLSHRTAHRFHVEGSNICLRIIISAKLHMNIDV